MDRWRPDSVRTYDDLVARLRALRARSGMSYRRVHKEVTAVRRGRGIAELPVYDTVYRCFLPGRSRMDADLVADVVGVLTGDEAEAARWRHTCEVVAGWAVAAAFARVSSELPALPRNFVGREEELATLLDRFGNSGAPARQGALGAVAPTVVIEGMAGVGKSALAIRAAHLLARENRFSALLFADLRGFDVEHPPADPAAVLNGFLRALGVQGREAAGLDVTERTARLRELTARRPVLAVLDDAVSAEQIEPLLPGGAGSVVLVTSRYRLGRHATVHLETFTRRDSLDLLRGEIGDVRVAREESSAAAVVEAAGHLPLAISVLAARIRETEGWSLADHAERLLIQREDHRLESPVQAALSASYRQLTAEQRRMLRFLGEYHPREADRYAAAALAGVDPPTADGLLADLAVANLLHLDGEDRYSMHDLVRDFAVACRVDEDPPSARRTALERLLDWYTRSAVAAARVYGSRTWFWFGRPAGPDLPELVTWDDADAWFTARRSSLVSVAMIGAEHGHGEACGRISAALAQYLAVRGQLDEAAALHRRAAEVSAGPARARATADLAATYIPTSRFAQSRPLLEDALAAYRELGDLAGQSRVLNMLGLAESALGRPRRARERFEAAIVLGEAGDKRLMPHPLANLGNLCSRMGRPDEALDCFRRALEVTDPADLFPTAQVLVGVGQQLARLGRYDEALDHLGRALRIAEATGHEMVRAHAHTDIGLALSGKGEHDRAVEQHRTALGLAEGHGFSALGFHDDLGVTLFRAGRFAESLAAYETALELSRDVTEPYVEACAHLGAARALEALGRSGVEHRERAGVLLIRLGLPEPAPCPGPARRDRI